MRSVAHIMAVSCSAIILILTSEKMSGQHKTKFGTRFYDFGNVVSKKKVEKMKKFFKRNRYREVRRHFQKWKADEGKAQDLFGQTQEPQKEHTVKKRPFKMVDEQKDLQAKSEPEEATEVKSLAQKRKKKRKRKKPPRTASYRKRKAKN